MTELDPLLPQSKAQPEQPMRTMVTRRNIILFVIVDVLLIGTALLVGMMIGKQSQLAQLPVATPSPMATPQVETVVETPSADVTENNSPVVPTNIPKPIAKASPAPNISSAALVSTDGWKSVETGSLSLKIPPTASITERECVDEGYDGCFTLKGHNPQSPNGQISILTKKYLGGSRRQEAGLNTAEGSRSIVEKTFGKNKVLEIFFICEISECSSFRQLLLVVGDQLVFATDANYYPNENAPSGYDVRVSPVTSTIISTMQAR